MSCLADPSEKVEGIGTFNAYWIRGCDLHGLAGRSRLGRFIHGRRSDAASAGDINWKLDLAWTAAVGAAAHANFVAGRLPALSAPVRMIEEIEIGNQFVLAIFHLSGVDDSVADELPRYVLRVHARGLRATWQIRSELRRAYP